MLKQIRLKMKHLVITNLAINAALNAKTNEVKGKKYLILLD